jgi:hypothetical protein
LFDDNSEIINNLELARKNQQKAAESRSPSPELKAQGEANGSGELAEDDQLS